MTETYKLNTKAQYKGLVDRRRHEHIFLFSALHHPTRKMCIHFAHKNCTRYIHNWCIQNVYHISTNFFIHLVCKIERTMPDMPELILYTKCIQKFVKMWGTFCIQTFCIHFVYLFWSTKSVHHKHYIYTNSYRMYEEIVVCRMDPLFQHILTHLLCTS